MWFQAQTLIAHPGAIGVPMDFRHAPDFTGLVCLRAVLIDLGGTGIRASAWGSSDAPPVLAHAEPTSPSQSPRLSGWGHRWLIAHRRSVGRTTGHDEGAYFRANLGGRLDDF